ncbi:G5 and 3D domain-containing protein [Peribacillus kribbensis]|uniref:G5 and 3D domain-containing protein n=1 Tax=Peribacillus kribbensis TaxID=356658 RepID=UPI000415CD15|nr:G5 and 3D domain-containing protein [Peribacillus kribbensis]
MKNLFSTSFNRKTWIMSIASVAVFAAAIGWILHESTKKTVSINLDGEQKMVQTHASTIGDILKDLEITVHAEDYLYPEADAKVKDHVQVVLKSAKQVQIIQNQEKRHVWSTANTVGDLVQQENLQISSYDQIHPSKETAIKNGMKLEIHKAFPVRLNVAGKSQQAWSTSMTVADFLGKQKIKVNNLDRTEPALHEQLKPGAMVNVIRVEKAKDVVEEPVHYAVITKKDDRLPQGTQKVMAQGQNGLVSKQYDIVRENGKEVSRRLVSQKMIRNKTNKIVAVGTKKLFAQVSRGNNSESGGREFYVNSTAYTANCSGCSGFTSTGINLKSNPNSKIIAVDPRVIPMGSKVYVEGYGYAVAADKGGAIKGNKIDVFFPTTSQAYKWGARKIKIKILN